MNKLASFLPNSKRLRDLIREIRAARTASDERAVIQKECAIIRESFRDEGNPYRCRNVAKLLYIYMLGYPAHFGQLECLKLIASSRFTDKRIGYLGAMLLLDEKHEVHLLITNSLKNDLSHESQYIVSLALCTLGCICSVEMSRDLAAEIEKLLKCNNVYIRKKAALVACCIIRKVPDLLEVFLPATRPLLNDKNHGVLLATISLITQMCTISMDTLQYFRKNILQLVLLLKNLICSGYSPEHDVSGISDPFLQIKILRLLRILGRDDKDCSEQMNDILAQVATNTETSKNVGHAILYEIVLTIMGVQSESGLRVLAVNILGRFLLNNDKNIRYVALNTLLRVVNADYNAVQRHRSTIVDCLKDPDVSIKKRAMELCFTLVNGTNIRGMVKELLFFLDNCDPEFKADCSSGLVTCCEQYAPDNRWHIDTIIRILTTSGNYVRDDVVTSLIQIIAKSKLLHTYAVRNLIQQVALHMDKQPLCQICAWIVGEYGNKLNMPCDAVDDDSKITEDHVIDILEKMLLSSNSLLLTKQYVIVSIMKLSTKFHPSTHQRLKKLISVYSKSTNVELQQRSIEFTTLFNKFDKIKQGLLEEMPLVEKSNISYSSNLKFTKMENKEDENYNNLTDIKSENADVKHSVNILDLINDESNSNGLKSNDKKVVSNVDLLDLLDLETGSTNLETKEVLFNGNNVNGRIEETSVTIPQIVAFNKSGILITFNFFRRENKLTIELNVSNNNNHIINDFKFQAAVPKLIQLNMDIPSSSTLPPFSKCAIKQTMNIINANKNPIKMRIRLNYTINNQNFTEQSEVNNFPQTTWQ